VQSFSKERTFTEIVRQYFSTSVTQRETQSYNVCDALSKLQLLQYSLYKSLLQETFAAFAASNLSRQRSPKYWSYEGSLGNISSNRFVSATASELLVLLQCPYCLGNSISSTFQASGGPFNRSFYSVRSIQVYRSYQYLSKQGQYPIEPTVLVQSQDSTPFKQALLKVLLPLYPSMGRDSDNGIGYSGCGNDNSGGRSYQGSSNRSNSNNNSTNVSAKKAPLELMLALKIDGKVQAGFIHISSGEDHRIYPENL
jgi:hypothetical protein